MCVVEITDERVERFFQKVCVAPGHCWIWIGSVDRKGYGHFRCAPGRVNKAHIFAYVLYYGEITPGHHVDHHVCDLPECVNPEHLRQATNAENNARSCSPSAINAKKTHCIRGHPFDDENTYILPADGYRRCRTCIRERELAEAA